MASRVLQTVANERLDGGTPFTGAGVRTTGTRDDEALDRGVQRFTADLAAARRLRTDSELKGRIVLPTVTLHARYDPAAFVGPEDRTRAVVEAAGNGNLLRQHITDESEHSKLADEGYVPVFGEVVDWVMR